MKQTIGKATQIVKGISTLDAMRGLIRFFIIITALGGAVRGGHSILDLVDPSFNPQIQTVALSCKWVDQIIPLPDGKMLVAGTFDIYDGQPVGGLVRLNADATLDTTFNGNLPKGWVGDMVVRQDGKILILGQYPATFVILRLNADGTTDTTFNFTLNGSTVSQFALDANGRIILGGIFNFNDMTRSVIRLNSNGSLDMTFQSTLNVFQVTALGAQGNKIIVGYNAPAETIQRINEDGTIDSSFNTRDFLVRSMIVQPDGKILIYGSTDLRRLNQDGSDDAGFMTTTFPLTSFGARRVMALSNDGKITAANRVNDFETYQVRKLLPDGTQDGSFTPYNAVRFNSLVVQPDGGVLIGDGDGACTSHPYRNDFVRLFPDGGLDPTFDTGEGFQTFAPSSVQAINVQPDGKILIGGEFTFVNGVPRYRIARVNPDSTIDPTFNINNGSAGYFTYIGSFSNIRTQSDGKIVATGSFNYLVNGSYKHNLVRLNSDGSIDPTFNLGVGLDNNRRFGTYPDGKLMVAGRRDSNGFPPVPVKLLATGERDTSFNPVFLPGKSLNMNDLIIQPDGKIIVGGYHRQDVTETNTYVYKSFLTRLNADGSLDATFQSREEPDKWVRSIVLQPNGKIVIAESTLDWIIPSQSNILRLNADGSLDPTFNAGTGANGKVNTMLRLANGKIFVGGKFTIFNGQPRANLVQLNADGSIFPTGYSLNEEVLSLAIDSEGRVLVGGNFTVINAGSSGAPRSYIARLVDSQQTRTLFDFDGDLLADLGIYEAQIGGWSILRSQTNQIFSMGFGLHNDKTVPADFDGDGKTDIAVYRPSEGNWYLMRSRDGYTIIRWGAAEDKPIAGDYDGDGKADLTVWRPSTAVWYVLQSTNGQWLVVNFGLNGDIPLSNADFDGDRKTDIAVWRPSDGNFYWLASGSANAFRAVSFGTNGDIPAVGDYNGDGKTDLVIYRPSEGNWHQYLTMPNGDYNYSVISFGLNGDVPVPADYDGDGKTDIAIKRGAAWHILNSTQDYTVQTFGNPTAQAVAALPIQ